MPEPTAAPRRPDYFDRLLARHTTVGNAGAEVRRALPRLPGPFERAEAQWNEVVQPSLVPPPLYPAREPGRQPPARQVLLERHTEIRTGPPAPAAPIPDPAPPPAHPQWITRPAPPERSTVGPRPDRAAVPRVTPDTSAEAGAVRPARPEQTAVRAAAATGPAPTARAMPRADQSAAVRRSTAQPSAPRRRPRSAEPTVHVRIGRLEVRAPSTQRAPTRAARAGRPAPSVNLSDYLSAGEGRP